MRFSRDSISDSYGIVEIVINEKSDEVLTITKDMLLIRIWGYTIYTKDKTMPPIDELPVNNQHVDKDFQVFIKNKKNIHLNMPIDQLSLNSVADILAVTALQSNDIALFSTKEGKNLYSL